MAQVFGFFCLHYLCLKSSIFHPLSLLRVDVQHPHGRCFCSGVTRALLLLFALSSLPGVPGRWALKSPQGVEGWGCLGCGPFCHIRFMGCTGVGKQPGTRFLEAPASLPLLPHYLSDCGRSCGWEARVVCAVSLAATRFSGMAGRAAAIRGPPLQALPLLSPGSTSPVSSSLPTFRYTGMWNSAGSHALGRETFVVSALLVVD